MSLPFFPDLVFAWVFLATLLGLLVAASVIDYRYLVVPKWITLTALPLGLLFNAVRGGWLGAQESPVWVLGAGGTALGILDGLLFALAGFALGFVLFFLLWILGVCGGGDVKLFAALGAWIGPGQCVIVLIATLVVLIVVVFVQIALRLFRGDWKAIRRPASPPKGLRQAKKRRLVGFSLPLTVAVTAVLLWSFRVELQLAPPREVSTAKVQGHAQ
jgi:prepilin peptidase CpaA